MYHHSCLSKCTLHNNSGGFKYVANYKYVPLLLHKAELLIKMYHYFVEET